MTKAASFRIAAYAALVVAACAPGGASSTASTATKSSGSYGLIRAEHPACQEAGTTAATYLDTGRPTDLDAAWGNQRQQVLQLSGERRALYIRQLADGYIQQCDQAASQAEAAAAAAKAAAEAQAQEEARRQAAQQHAADVLAKRVAICPKVGGNWSARPGTAVGGYCQIDYRSPADGQLYHYNVAFDQEGNIIPFPGGPQNPDECARGVNMPGVMGHWHADTMICAI